LLFAAIERQGDAVVLVVVLLTCIGAVLLLVAAILLTVCMYRRRKRSPLPQRRQGIYEYSAPSILAACFRTVFKAARTLCL